MDTKITAASVFSTHRRYARFMVYGIPSLGV